MNVVIFADVEDAPWCAGISMLCILSHRNISF